NSRLPTTLNARDQPPAEVSDQRVSGLTGAVHMSYSYFVELPRLEDIEPGAHTDVLIANSRVDQGRIRAAVEAVFDAHPAEPPR
ncbi:hypothetical protein AN27_04079, partial [Mycobacterium tuberculosis TKK_04_0155]